MRLRTRLVTMIGTTFLTSSVIAAAVIVPYQAREMRASIERARLDLRFAAMQLQAPLLDLGSGEASLVTSGLWPAAQKRLENLPRETASVSVCALYDARGARQFAAPQERVREEYPPAALPPEVLRLFEQHKKPIRRETHSRMGWVVELYHPLVDSGQVQGALLVVHSLAAVEHHQRLVVFGVAALLALLLLVLTVLSGAFLRRAVVGRLAQLAELMQRAGRGKLDVAFADPLRSPDEIASIGVSFNGMVEGLREREYIRATFGRYVSEDVARRILSSKEAAALGGEERIVTVMLTDIRNYSTISERLPPADVVRMLNSYMGAMGELIDAHEGCVIEYLGDAILCVFGAPGDLPEHATAATRCGIAMVARLAELNREWEASGLAKLWQEQGVPSLGTRMGIHTGRVVAGNVGSASRVKYAVVGDAVNVSARIEGLNKDTGTDMLVTFDTYDLLPEDLKSRAIPKGAHNVKGRAQDVQVYTFA
jgi:class 3 adenylate cyclase